MDSRSKAWVCGRALAGIAGPNPAGGMDVCCECCVLSVRGLCVGLITRPPNVCVNSDVKPGQRGGTGPIAAVAPCKKMSYTPLSFPLFISTCFVVHLLYLNVLQLLHHFYSLHPPPFSSLPVSACWNLEQTKIPAPLPPSLLQCLH